MDHVFHRHTRSELPVAASGDGMYIVARDGRRFLDGSGGAAVSALGHSDPDVRQAIIQQVEALAFAHTGFFTTEAAEALADYLVSRAPTGIERVYFLSGGSEGIEAALKMARQYFVEIGQPERTRFIARRQSYHGNTLGALSVGGNRARRAPFAPLLFDTTHIAPCYAYREQGPGETELAYGERAASELEQALLEVGPDTVIGFVAEPVVGASLGAVPAVAGYLARIRDICDRYGVLLILDEVMCGMGRTGTLHACEQDGVAPDLLIAAKGLGAGYQPIGAVLVAAKLFDAFRDGSGFFQHGHTYIGHATACAAALAVQNAIVDRDLLANVRAMGAVLESKLHERFGNHHHIGDIRGRGLFRAIELVADRATKEPFDPAMKLHARIKSEAMTRELIVYPGGGTMDGTRGDHVLVAPPFIAERHHIDSIVERLGDAVDAAIESLDREK
ncbi:MAG: aspartate aminotransferase family protein [Proteobacteria bacterium]|nr:aspartate aminotransferase family protein [Pseudomonadota bacterium]